MTTVINLIAGPGAGKSTVAALLYAKMKASGYDVELVREVAKEWAHEGKKIGPFEQMCIIGEQIKKESSLFGKVDYIVTDSPVLLGGFYFSHNHKQAFMCHMIRDYYSFGHLKDIQFKNYLLQRNVPYDAKGRFETEDEAKKIDRMLRDHMEIYNYEFEYLSDDPVKDILLELK